MVRGIASVRAVEDALGIEVPRNAQLIRNLMIGAQYVHDHVMHFYHLHALDWVDVVSALSADPAATSQLAQGLSGYPNSAPGYFADVRRKLKGFVEQGPARHLRQGLLGTPRVPAAARGEPDGGGALSRRTHVAARRRATAHDLRRQEPPSELRRGRHTGAHRPRLRLRAEPAAPVAGAGRHPSDAGVHRPCYVPDTLAIASWYKDWATQGEGVGNFLCYGDPPARGVGDPRDFLFPRGAILGRDLATVHEVDLKDPTQIQEFVSHSWYEYGAGKDHGLHPFEGETRFRYDGPRPPYKQLDVEKSYGWIKSPRSTRRWDARDWPARASGTGFMEAPRDAQGQPGPYEAALVGHRLADPAQPIEILRTIHSFDPCVACAVHVAGEGGTEALELRLRKSHYPFRPPGACTSTDSVKVRNSVGRSAPTPTTCRDSSSPRSLRMVITTEYSQSPPCSA